MATQSLNTFYENVKWPRIQTNPETAIAGTTYYPASGSFIDVTGFRRFTFAIQAGALDTALTFQVVQATAVDGTPKDVTGALEVVGTGDDGENFLIEVSTDQLDGANGYHYVSLYATGASGSNDYAALNMFLYGAVTQPVTQTSALPAANVTILVA